MGIHFTHVAYEYILDTPYCLSFVKCIDCNAYFDYTWVTRVILILRQCTFIARQIMLRATCFVRGKLPINPTIFVTHYTISHPREPWWVYQKMKKKTTKQLTTSKMIIGDHIFVKQYLLFVYQYDIFMNKVYAVCNSRTIICLHGTF